MTSSVLLSWIQLSVFILLETVSLLCKKVRSRLEDVVVAGDRRCDSPVNHLLCYVHGAYRVSWCMDLDLDALCRPG